MRRAVPRCAALLALILAGCGSSKQPAAVPAPKPASKGRRAASTPAAAVPIAHPQAVEPVAGKASPAALTAPSSVSVGAS